MVHNFFWLILERVTPSESHTGDQISNPNYTKIRKPTFLASTRVGDPLGWPAEVKTLIRGEMNELREFFFLLVLEW